jgi:hypothetical protein
LTGIKNWPKKKKLLFIIIASVLAAGIVLGIVLPIVLRDTAAKVPTVSFDAFNMLSEYTVTVRWTAIKRAVSYDVEYDYSIPRRDTVTVKVKAGEEVEKTSRLATVKQTSLAIDRKMGSVRVRVRANFAGGEGEFSGYKLVQIPPIILAEPKDLLISSHPNTDLVLTFSNVNYMQSPRTAVFLYCYEWGIEGVMEKNGPVVYQASQGVFGQSISLRGYIYHFFRDYPAEKPDGWTDVKLTVRLKALTYDRRLGTIYTEGDAELLYDAFEENGYTTAEFTLDYEKISAIVARGPII